MIFDIVMLIPFLPVQNKYSATRLVCANYDKKDTDYQKVQVTDEIKRDLWKYLVFSDVADDT